MKTITFDSSVREDVLKGFDKKVNKDGIIVEQSNPEQKVLAQDGEEVNIQQFAGVRRGSQIFIKSDLPSILRLADIIK